MTMVTMSVIYPRTAGGKFDYAYYERVHLPLVASRWERAGLAGAQAFRGISSPAGGEAAFFAIALIHFESLERLQSALTGEHASEIMADIAKFTDVEPLLQVNEAIGE